MKKILLFFLAVLTLTQSVWAGLVTPERAAQSARGMLGMKESPVLENERSIRTAGRDGQGNTPEYYVFNNPKGGWAIIAADDRVNPVVAYSYEGSFNSSDMPDNLKWWMEGVSEYIDIVRNSDMVASDAVKAAWEYLQDGAPQSEKKELMTAKWNQDEPYNNMCPIVNGENTRSVTGCVATAMAIVMQYYKWPAHGKGVIGGYTTYSTQTYIPPYSIDDHYYNWDLLSDDNSVYGRTGKFTSEQKKEVAKLMYDCGVSVEMEYSSEGSGTSTGLTVAALKNNMSYSESTTLLSRSRYNLDKWYSMLKREIDEDRVVLYSGSGEAGGHAFVCDGYDTEGSMVHINWGWGNYDINGFYTIDLELPENYGFSFSNDQSAVFGIAPDTSSVVLEENAGLTCISYDGFYGIEPYIPADMKSGAEIQFFIGWFRNDSDRDVKREFKVCLMDKEGNVRQEGWHLTMNFPAFNGYSYADKTGKDVLSVDPELTDYFKVYVRNDEGEWGPMHGNNDLFPDNDGLKCGVLQDPLIILPDDCAAGKKTELSLSLGYSYVTSVKWIVNGKELEDNVATFVSGKNEIRAVVEYMDESSGYISRTVNLE